MLGVFLEPGVKDEVLVMRDKRGPFFDHGNMYSNSN